MPDPDPPRKPPNRIWLFAPFVLAMVIVVGWSGAWLVFRANAAAQIDATAQRLRAEGWTVNWKHRAIAGYPFRIEVSLDDAEVAEPSGWALATPKFEAVADAYDLGHWMVAATRGVVLTRPNAGAVSVQAYLMRASVVATGVAPPRIEVEARKLAFTPAPGAKPLPIASADYLQFDVRPAADGSAQVYAKILAAKAQPGGALALMAGDLPVLIEIKAWVAKVGALQGRDWPSAVRGWTAAGGGLNVYEGQMSVAGGPSAITHNGSLAVDDDGLLTGTLPTVLTGAGPLLARLGQTRAIDPIAAFTAGTVINAHTNHQGASQVDVDFQSGATTLGPVAVAPAPRVF